MEPGPTSPPAAVPYAGVLRRGACYLVDSTVAFGLVVGVQALVLTPLREAVGVSDEWFRDGLRTELYTLATISLPVWSLFAVGDSLWRSPGRRLLGLRVVVAGGAAPSFGRAWVRAVAKLLPWEVAHLANNLPTPLWYAEDPGLRVLFPVSGVLLVAWALMVGLRGDHRGPHDLLAGTDVVRVSPPAR